MIQINFKKLNGLIPAIAQDYKKGKILMLAFMNKQALKKTLKTGKAWYYSRSRNKLWMKGEQSGNVQIVKDILVDCDQDSIILKVQQKTAACHEGYASCFYRRLKDGKIIEKKLFDPKEVYKK